MNTRLFEMGRMYFPPYPGRDHFFAWFIGYNEAPHVRVRIGFFGRICGLVRFQRCEVVNTDNEHGHGWQLRIWRIALCVFFQEQ